ncbi:MAG: hypothetical protein H7263_11690, partial [Candidatus Sericytochromatia bacterium]|nr:hypothetical protein [Candidatus Sericytochromatia bacterium]
MQVPSSLQDTWSKVTKDKSVSADDYKELLKAAAPNGKDEELDDDEAKFLSTLNSELKKNGIATKGTVPVDAINFGEKQVAQTVAKPEEIPTPDQAKEAANNPQSVDDTPPVETTNSPTAEQAETPDVTAKSAPAQEGKGLSGGLNFSVDIANPNLPKTAVLLNWTGYNKQVNTAFETAFGEKPGHSTKAPVLSKGKSDVIFNAFGAGSVKQMQQTVGAKQDDKFGPETYFRAKTHVASQINESESIEKLTQLKSLIGVLGNDPEVSKMSQVLDQRIGAVQSYLASKGEAQGYFAQVNTILSSADPKNMQSLVNAKTNLHDQFNQLSDSSKSLPQVSDMNTQAQGRLDSAISSLQGNIDQQNILGQKQQLVGELNDVLSKSISSGLTTGDTGKIQEGKKQIDATLAKYPAVKDSNDINELKQQANKQLDDVGSKITGITTLIAKKDWTPEDGASAVKSLGELPAGDFKNKLSTAIDGHSEVAKLKEKAKANTPTTLTGLHDVIGNGFWNAENSEGTKGLFQLIAKQGLLPDTMSKMSVDDQTRAIKVLTKDVKFDKMNDSEKFNVGIAKTIYDNLSKSANVDGDIKDKNLPSLKKETTPANFSNFNIDTGNYVKGMQFSIGDDRIGSEKEAALTMARGIMYGDVSKQTLGQLNRYELNDLTKFVKDKGSKDEKNELLKTVSQAYSEGVSVNIESLDKSDKSKVIKGILDMPKVDESKLDDLIKKSGKKIVFDLVKNENLSNDQLVTIAKHTSG